jgi:hypothetical protein
MIWKQEKQNNNYEYSTEDFIGKIKLVCGFQLNAKLLDACYLKLMNINSLEGEILANEGVIKYTLIRNSEWLDDDEEIIKIN